MTASPALVVSRLLIGPVFSDPIYAAAWPLFVSFMPAQPDDCASINDTGGVKDGRVMTGRNVFHWGIQLTLRSRTSYDAGWQKGIDACEFLETVQGNFASVNGRLWQVDNVSQRGPLLNLGVEAGSIRRNLYSANFLVTLREG